MYDTLLVTPYYCERPVCIQATVNSYRFFGYFYRCHTLRTLWSTSFSAFRSGFCSFTPSRLLHFFCFNSSAPPLLLHILFLSPFLCHSHIFHLASFPCSIFRTPFLFPSSRFISLTLSALLLLSRFIYPEPSVSLFLLRPLSLVLFSFRLSLFRIFLFIFSAFALAPSNLFVRKDLLSLTMSFLLAESSAQHCVSVDKSSPTRSCFVYGLALYDRCNACSKFAPVEAVELSFRESRSLACSRVFWNLRVSSSFCIRVVLVPGPVAAPARASKEPGPFSSSPLKNCLTGSAPSTENSAVSSIRHNYGCHRGLRLHHHLSPIGPQDPRLREYCG